MIGRTPRKERITLREETGLKAKIKDPRKVNLQKKETLIKRRKFLMRKRFSVSNVRNLTLYL